MKIITILAALALTAAPAFADNFGAAGGVFGGIVQSHSSGGSFANSSGHASQGRSGGSFIRNEQSAGQLAGAHGQFEGASNGRLTKGTIVTETFSDGFSQSRTITRNNGANSAWGSGEGWASNWGDASAAGGFAGLGGSIGSNWGGNTPQ